MARNPNLQRNCTTDQTTGPCGFDRDATAILIAYRHGLRASELCELTWNMIELDSGRIHVRRAKNGVDSTHPLTGKEIRALRQLRRENLQSRYVFNTERGGPVTRAWFLKMVRR